MDPAALAARLEAIDGRLACTDAERRAAAMCSAELRGLGRRPRTQTLWVRPQWALPYAVHAAIGIAASIVAVSDHVVGVALAGGALLATLLHTGGFGPLGLLLPRRATQNVVAASPEPTDWIRLILTASVDAPRDALLHWAERRLRGRLVPGVVGLLDLALAAVAACAGARVAGADGTPIAVVQLVVSVLLVVLFGLFLEEALAKPAPDASASGPAAAIAVAAALEQRPPKRLAVEVVIAGAGEAGAAGLRRYVRAHRHTLAAERVVVLHLGSAPGDPRALRRDGRSLPIRLHPRLAELAGELVDVGEARGVSGARAARAAGWPALALEGEPRALAGVVLALVEKVDADVRP